MDLPAYTRKIIHIDMDAFYASVEQRDHPEYRGLPLIVGGMPDRRGVVATASYEARKFGIRSAMSSVRARQLCPEAIFVFPRFDAYKEVSRQIREIFRRHTDIIEPLSLDEAFLDVTEDKQGIGSALEIARLIKDAIRNELQLTASAGVSVSKFVAKIASDMNKPDGLTFIGPSRIQRFMEELPVEKFFGVGKVTAERMKRMQLYTGADLKRLSEEEMVQHFGKTGRFYYKIVRGIDDRPVQAHRTVKSVASEDTFENDLDDPAALHAELEKITGRLMSRLERYGLKGRTITLKIKFADFRQITRNQSFQLPVGDGTTILATAVALLERAQVTGRKIRLLGIAVSNFGTEGEAGEDATNQLRLF